MKTPIIFSLRIRTDHEPGIEKASLLTFMTLQKGQKLLGMGRQKPQSITGSGLLEEKGKSQQLGDKVKGELFPVGNHKSFRSRESAKKKNISFSGAEAELINYRIMTSLAF